MGIMAQLWLKNTNYTSLHLMIGSAELFYGTISRQKLFIWNVAKNPLLEEMGNFGPFVAQNFASLYLRISFKNFLQSLLYDVTQILEIPILKPMGNFGPFVGKNYASLYHLRIEFNYFFKLSSMIRCNK